MAKRINYRFYWNHPSQIEQLPDDLKKKVLAKFFELVEKSKSANNKRMSRIMKERNEQLPLYK
ncbi:MAG: hypothetical protein JSV58_03620 [Candidatus Bathyarchaeota archaeon]|nr:MAG: hypothetical protein JSV58_03620 [Candidatus Bathyarchaeota archaeon]